MGEVDIRAAGVYGALCRASSRYASLMVVELADLSHEEDASVWRDALGYMGLAALLEVVGSNRHGDTSGPSGLLLTVAPETTTAQ